MISRGNVKMWVVSTSALCLAFVLPARAQNAEQHDFECPRGELRPLGRHYDAQGAFINTPMGILAPLALFGTFFDFIYSDNLAKLPKAKVAFSVKGVDGKPANNAVLAVLYDGVRFLAQIPVNGKLIDLPTGDYVITAMTTGQTIRWGRQDVTLKAGKTNRIDIKADQTVPDMAPPALSRPTPAGSVMELDLLDGMMRRATIAVFKDDKMVWQHPVGRSPVRIIAPPEAGRYTMRVIACAPQVAVATWPFEITPTTIALIAPPKVAAGSTFELRWRGDGAQGDLIGFRRKGQSAILPGEAKYSGSGEKRLALVAPFEAGDYEIVYRSSLGPTLMTSTGINVTPSELVIKAPQTIVAGEMAEFIWPSGAGLKSELTLWRLDATHGLPVATLNTSGLNRLVVPPGQYRLMLKDGDAVHWSQRITITPSRMLEAIPKDLAPGAKLTISDKNLGLFDQFVIVPARARDLSAHTIERGNEFRGQAELTTPSLSGRYEIIYLAADHANDKRELARAPLIVSSPDGQDLSLSAPKEVGVLEETILSWPDPDEHSLEIWLKAANRPAKLVRRVEHAGKMHLALLPGTYEMRLVKNTDERQPKSILHQRVLTVLATKILREVPTEVTRGASMRFRVEGKPGFFDRIVIAQAGLKSSQDDELGIGVDASDNEIDVPQKPGRYELIYLSQGNDRKLTPIERVPFVVK